MPALQRRTLMMICADGVGYEEAARLQKCSIGTVKSRLWRARRSMQEFVSREQNAATCAALTPRSPSGLLAA
jgi:RNA polymerase sigma-70 factor (ECF subfamily)